MICLPPGECSSLGWMLWSGCSLWWKNPAIIHHCCCIQWMFISFLLTSLPVSSFSANLFDLAAVSWEVCCNFIVGLISTTGLSHPRPDKITPAMLIGESWMRYIPLISTSLLLNKAKAKTFSCLCRALDPLSVRAALVSLTGGLELCTSTVTCIVQSSYSYSSTWPFILTTILVQVYIGAWNQNIHLGISGMLWTVWQNV